MNQTAIFAHRGLSSLYPENTMVAFQAAANIKVEGIELDVQLSKDNIPVVIHDSTLERTTNGKGTVHSYNVEELKRLQAGEWFSKEFKDETIPTLEEVLIWCQHESITLNIEIKADVLKRELLQQRILSLLSDYQMEDRVIISSFDHKIIQAIKAAAPYLESAIIVSAALERPDLYLKTVGVEGYHFSYDMMIEKEIEQLLKEGIKLRPYTINERVWMKRFMKWGCHAIFTDYPQNALRVRMELN